MITNLDDLIAALAAHLSHSRGISLASAERTVRRLVDEAWTEYLELGAPLGEDDEAFARWIVERPRRPSAA